MTLLQPTDSSVLSAVDADEVWEPWQPKVGDRVRVRLSAECRKRWRDVPNVGHQETHDGCVGRVYQVNRRWDHPYYVSLDDAPPRAPEWVGDRETEKCWLHRVLLCGACAAFAAIELEPLGEVA